MRVFDSLRSVVSALFHRSLVENEVEEELRAHIQDRANDLERSGVPRAEAERRARLEFGGYQKYKEEIREAQGTHFLETLIQDLRFGLRMLRKSPGFTVIAVLSVALGIGVNATFFSAIDCLLLRPPANVEAPEKLVSPYQTVATGGAGGYMPVWSYPDYLYYRDRNAVFSGLSAYSPAPFSLAVKGSDEKAFGDLVSGNYFSVLGTKAFLGRVFVPEEDDTPSASPVTVVSYEFWRDRLGSDPTVLGRAITINNLPFTVVGVAPKDMTDIGVQIAPTVWVPLAAQSEVGWPPGESDALKNRETGWLTVVGRLKQDVTRKQALADLTLISRQLAKDYPALEQGRGVSIESAAALPPFIRGAAIGFVVVLEGLGALFLLIPCANVGSLMLARAWARQTEITIRYSLGASRPRVVRQLLSESLLLGLCGGAVGLLLAYWGTAVLIYLKPPIGFPFAVDLRPDARVIGFTLLLALATVLLFGIAPALHLSGESLASHLGGRSYLVGPRGSRAKRVLVVAQVSTSLLLLLGAGLCVHSLRNASHIDPGFDTSNILSFSASPTLSGYSAAQAEVYYRRLLERLNATGGVQSAALAAVMPLSYGQLRETVQLDGASRRTAQQIPVGADLVSPEYFRTIGIPIVRGRSFLGGEDDKNAVVVNETLAKRLFPGQNPIGHRLKVGGGQHPRSMEIIGIAQNSKYRTLGENSQPFFYEPLVAGLEGPVGTTVLVKTTGASQSSFSAIRTQAAALDKSIPISPIETMSEHIRSALWLARTLAILLGSLGGMGLFLAMIGLYGTVAYSVSRRTHEIGIRMALGAQRTDALKLVVSEGLFLTLTGLGIGLIAALTLTRFLGSLLYGLSATDPLTFLGVSILFVTVALLACCIPARRAMRVDPMVALRYE